jgi:thioredoxin 1
LTLEKLDQFGFHHRLAETPGIALVCFTAPHCGACKAMRQALLQLAEVRPDIRLFEVDSQRDAALTREFELFHLPALFLYRRGEYHAAVQTEPRVSRLLETLDTLLSQPAREAP